jgi:hypothetical protein
MLGQILSGTPAWLFALLAFLIYQGATMLRPNIVALRRVFVTPIIFIVWGLIGLAGRPYPWTDILAAWLPAALAAGFLGAALCPRDFRADRERALIERRGSALPLVRNLAIFGAHYVLNVAAALRPDLRPTLMLCDIAVSGISTGYFAGWAWRFLSIYRITPHSPLTRIGEAAAAEAARS